MRYLALVLVILTTASCAPLQNLDQALALKAYSDEKDAQESFVKKHDAQFEALLKQAASADAFKKYKHQTGLIAEFGDPILCRSEQGLNKCLYRRIVKPMQSPKVYFYFDDKKQLVRWELVDINKEYIYGKEDFNCR